MQLITCIDADLLLLVIEGLVLMNSLIVVAICQHSLSGSLFVVANDVNIWGEIHQGLVSVIVYFFTIMLISELVFYIIWIFTSC